MTVTVWLVRHGLKSRQIGDVPLTPAGVKQAQAAARALQGGSIGAIVSSPLRRALETAGYLANRLGIEPVEDARLRERANWGDIPDQTFEEFVAVWDRCTREPDYRPPGGGDSVREAAARLSEAVSDWTKRGQSGSGIFFVTHGGLITDFLGAVFAPDMLNAAVPDFAARQNLLIPECSITELLVDGPRLRLGIFADIAHLRGLNLPEG